MRAATSVLQRVPWNSSSSRTVASSVLRATGAGGSGRLLPHSTSTSPTQHTPCFASSSRCISSTPTLYDNETPPSTKLEYSAVPKADMGEYQEYSVIFTNRNLNLMSAPFQQVMRDLNDLLKMTYNAHKVAIMPG